MNSSYYKIKHSPLSLQKFPEHLKSDKALVAYATSLNEDAFKFAAPQLKSDKEFILELLNEGLSRFIPHIDSSLHSDTTIMKKALPMNGLLLQHVDETLRNNREMCDLAIAHTPYAFKYVGQEIKKDTTLTLKVLQESGYLFKDIDPVHFTNKEIIKAPLISSVSYCTFDKMSQEMRSDKDFLLELISLEHGWGVLAYASPELKDDEELVKAACAKHPDSINIASDRLKNNFDIVLSVVKQKGDTLRFIHNELKFNKQIILQALKSSNNNAYQYVDETIKKEIGKNDPIQYLEKFLAQEELQRILPLPSSSNKRRNKI